ncbi:phage tail assembly chaperone [Clostridium minihomine]|uniref:phage tail assembly chaperone n=1 Tax=Clostridium minihomine TaxID=2045012 RepID=UPI000C758255|nr:hypothetical protein [Clostridium minihomine]
MDKSLELFLNPNRKPNKKFKMSTFGEAEFEMKVLSAEEGAQASVIAREKKLQGIEMLYPTIIASLVSPNLRSAELLDALSQREGRKVLDAMDAFKLLFTDAEVSSLISIYNDYAEVTFDFNDKVEEAKN